MTSGNTLVKFLMLFALLSPLDASSSQAHFVNGTRSKRGLLGKKYLIFPQGSNVQLVYCMTIGSYAQPSGTFTFGVTAGLAYELPYRKTVPYRKPAEVYHRRSRRDLYRKLELMLKAEGKDGEACVLKSLCRAGKRHWTDVGKGSFVSEMLHSIFTLPHGHYNEDPKTKYEEAYNSDGNCDELYPTCPKSIL